MSLYSPISEENQRFMETAFPSSLRILWVRVGAATAWWDDFVTADLMGWTFRVSFQEGRPTSYTASRDAEHTSDFDMAPLLLRVLNAAHAEWHTNPKVAGLRKAGWRCMGGCGLYYLQRADHIEPIYISPAAAWAGLLRSQA